MSLFSGRREDGSPDGAQPAAAGSGAPARSGASARPTQTTPGHRGDITVANIGKSIEIKGDLSGNEDMIIEGKVDGKVELPTAVLTIGANGVVRAEVNAKAVVVVGRCTGNVNGSERVEIQATGVVDGDVSAPRLVVAEGAVINGSIHMTKQSQAATSTPTPTPTPDARRTA